MRLLPRSPLAWVAVVVAALAVGVCSAAAVTVVSDPLGLKAVDDSDFPNVLTWVVPSGREGEEYVGLDSKDAATLSAAGDFRKWPEFGERVRLVPGDQPSTGNLVVSVNPIDRFTWAAVALSSSGRCYATLVRDDPANPSNGSTFFARFPPGTLCKGSMATVETVRLPDIPE